MSPLHRPGQGLGPSLEWNTLPIVGAQHRRPGRVSRLRWLAIGFVLAIILMKLVG